MSRVKKPGNKWGNDLKHDPSETAPSKVARKKAEKTDYTKAGTLSSWLFLKYDLSYNAYRKKSKQKRAELRREYEQDTGITYQKEAYALLHEIGVPFDPTGEPLGIGWDD